MAGRARKGWRSQQIGGSKAKVVDTEDNNTDGDGGGGGGGGSSCQGGCRKGRGFNRGDRGDFITLLVKASKLNLEFFYYSELKNKGVY